MRRELKGKICEFSVTEVPFHSLSVCISSTNCLSRIQNLCLLAWDLGIEDEIKDRESRINDQFTNLREHGYRIHSVFIHRGKYKFLVSYKRRPPELT